MEQGNETDSIVVTAKNCRSLIGKRVSIAVPGETKKVVDFVDKTEDKEKVANNIDGKDLDQKEVVEPNKEQSNDKENKSLVNENIDSENSAQTSTTQENPSDSNDRQVELQSSDKKADQINVNEASENPSLTGDIKNTSIKDNDPAPEETKEAAQPENNKDKGPPIEKKGESKKVDKPNKSGIFKKTSISIENKKKTKTKDSKTPVNMGTETESAVPETSTGSTADVAKPDDVVDKSSAEAVKDHQNVGDTEAIEEKQADSNIPTASSTESPNEVSKEEENKPTGDDAKNDDIGESNAEVTSDDKKATSDEIKTEKPEEETSKDVDVANTTNPMAEAVPDTDSKENVEHPELPEPPSTDEKMSETTKNMESKENNETITNEVKNDTVEPTTEGEKAENTKENNTQSIEEGTSNENEKPSVNTADQDSPLKDQQATEENAKLDAVPSIKLPEADKMEEDTIPNTESGQDSEKENEKMLKDIKILNISIEEEKPDTKLKKKPQKKELSSSKKTKLSKVVKTNKSNNDVEMKVDDQISSDEKKVDNINGDEPVLENADSKESTEIKNETVKEPEAIDNAGEAPEIKDENQEAPNDVETKEVTDDTPADSLSTDILKDTDGNETSLLDKDVPTNIEVPKVSIKQPMEEKTPSGSTPEFEWNFDSPAPTTISDKNEDFNTMGVATARRQARERTLNDRQSSPPERRSASVGGPNAYRRSRYDAKPASAMSYLQLLSSSTITYQEIYGGARFFRARPIYYIPNGSRAAVRLTSNSRNV